MASPNRSRKLLIASSLCLALVLAFTFRPRSSGGSKPARFDAAPTGVEAQPRVPATVLTPSEQQLETRTEVVRSGTEPGPSPEASTRHRHQLVAPVSVRGQVFHVRGYPTPGARVVARRSASQGAKAEAVSGSDGGFQIALSEAHDQLSVDDERYVTLRSSEVQPTSLEVVHPIIVADSIQVSGGVVEEHGRPVLGSEIQLVLPREVYGKVPAALDTTREQGKWRTRSDARGIFAFEELPAVPGGLLEVRHPHYAERSDPSPVFSDVNLMIVLQRPVPSDSSAVENVLEGRVVFPGGAPAAGARVSLGSNMTLATTAGDFELTIGPHRPDDNLVAVLGGWQPAVIESFGSRMADRRGPVVMVLPGEAYSIAGRLLDAARTPCVGWDIKLLDGTVVDGSFPPVFAEDHAAGGAGRNPNMQKTDENGRFHMGGLLAGRSYVVRAWNESTLCIYESEPIRSGARDTELIVPTDDVRERVWGRVTGLDGTPIAGVKVRLTMRVHDQRGSTTFHTGQWLHTGADGHFEFADVPRVDLLLRFTGEQVDSLYYEFSAADAGQDLEIRLERRCHLRFECLPGPGAPDAIRVLDSYGQSVRAHAIEAGRSRGMSRAPLTEGLSGVLAVSERAHWLVIERDRVEIDRRVLRLSPGAVTHVRY